MRTGNESKTDRRRPFLTIVWRPREHLCLSRHLLIPQPFVRDACRPASAAPSDCHLFPLEPPAIAFYRKLIKRRINKNQLAAPPSVRFQAYLAIALGHLSFYVTEPHYEHARVQLVPGCSSCRVQLIPIATHARLQLIPVAPSDSYTVNINFILSG